MKLTDETKEEFENYLRNTGYGEMIGELVPFFEYPLSMQIGVLILYFEAVNIYINISNESYKDGVNTLWQVFEYNNKTSDGWTNNSTGCYGDNGEYTLKQAWTQAITKASEIREEQLNEMSKKL